MTRRLTFLCAAALSAGALTLAGCGDDNETNAASTPATTAATTASDVDFAPIKSYLTDHTARLTKATGELATQAQTYYDMAQDVGDENLLKGEHAQMTADLVAAMQKSWRAANPAYEEMEGIVAGVPSLAKYDNILDAGTSAAEDPENAVPFDLTYPDGTVLKKPGNYFYLTETSLWGSEPKFVVPGVQPDLDGDGKVEYGEALPLPDHIVAAAKGFDEEANKLAKDAAAWQPTESDVFNAVVVMTPTMAEYFEAWKNSRFVAGDKATEASFIGSSRLNDITGILTGLTVIYDGIEPKIATEDPQTAAQAGENLDALLAYVRKLQKAEEGGRTYTAEQADTYGTEAQKRAEAIAGQVSQAADALNIKIEG